MEDGFYWYVGEETEWEPVVVRLVSDGYYNPGDKRSVYFPGNEIPEPLNECLSSGQFSELLTPDQSAQRAEKIKALEVSIDSLYNTIKYEE